MGCRYLRAGAEQVSLEPRLAMISLTSKTLYIACENIRFSSLFAARNVPSDEERGETDVFAGYALYYLVSFRSFVWRVIEGFIQLDA